MRTPDSFQPRPVESEPQELPASPAETSSSEAEWQMVEKYKQMVKEHHDLTYKIKNLTTRSYDQRAQNKIAAIDSERHTLHLRIVGLAKKMGKNESDIIVDLVREQRTLEEYGLPEFSILSDADVIGDEDVLPRGHFLMVFDVQQVYAYSDWEPHVDYAIRSRRAQALADELKASFFRNQPMKFHTGETVMIGVIIPDEDFQKACSTIRDNPKKFRLKEEFYGADELKIIQRAKEEREKRSKEEEKEYKDSYDGWNE